MAAANSVAQQLLVAAQANLATIGAGPSQAMSQTYQAMAASIGLEMQNAVNNQQKMQILTDAAVAQTLVLILKNGASG